MLASMVKFSKKAGAMVSIALMGVAYKYLIWDEKEKKKNNYLKSYQFQSLDKYLKKDSHLPLDNNFFTFNTNHDGHHEDYFSGDQIVFVKDDKVKEIVEATYQIQSLCLELVDEVVNNDSLMDLFDIPVNLRPLVRDSWAKRETDFLGRFDFLIDKQGQVKLLEYNGDTPTLLIESGRIQHMVYDNIKKVDLKQSIFYKEKLDFENYEHSNNSNNKTNLEDPSELFKGYYGKYLSEDKSFFFNNEKVGIVERLSKSLTSGAKKLSSYFYYLKNWIQVPNQETEKIPQIDEAYLNQKKEKINSYVSDIISKIDFKEYNFIESSIKQFWKNLFKVQIERNILCSSVHSHEEEKQTALYIESLANETLHQLKLSSPNSYLSNIKIKNIDCKDMHYNIDKANKEIHVCDNTGNNYNILWKLYPYEWLVDEEFGHLFEIYEDEGLSKLNIFNNTNKNASDKTNEKKTFQNIQLNLKNIYDVNTNYLKSLLLKGLYNHLKTDKPESELTEDEKKKVEDYNKLSSESDFEKKQAEIMANSIVLQTHFLEPAWKLIVSSKALLPALYERYPDHPNLIPAYFENPFAIRDCNDEEKKNYHATLTEDLKNYPDWVVKPLYGREGQNIKIKSSYDLQEEAKKALESKLVDQDNYIEDSRDPSHKLKLGKCIYQGFSESEKIDKTFITIGSWTINGIPAGIIIRGSEGKILSDEKSHFFPHLVHFNKDFQLSLKLESENLNTLRKELYGDEEEKFKNIFENFYPMMRFNQARANKSRSSRRSNYRSTKSSSTPFFIRNDDGKNKTANKTSTSSSRPSTGSTASRASSTS